MNFSQAFRVQRVACPAGTRVEVYPPCSARSVCIGNATAGDVQVHTCSNGAEYLVVAAGYERIIPGDGRWRFSVNDLAFWLEAAETGTVVLVWQ